MAISKPKTTQTQINRVAADGRQKDRIRRVGEASKR